MEYHCDASSDESSSNTGGLQSLISKQQKDHAEAHHLEREATHCCKQEQNLLIKLSAAHNADATSGLLMLEDQLLISIASFLSIHDLGCGFSRVCRRVVKSKIVETAAQLQLGLEPQYMQQWVQQIQAQQKLSPLRLLAAASEHDTKQTMKRKMCDAA